MTKRGSTAFRTASQFCASISSVIAASFDASILTPEKRSETDAAFSRALPVVVGYHDLFEVASARRYMGKHAPDTTGSYYENAHGTVLSSNPINRAEMSASWQKQLRRSTV